MAHGYATGLGYPRKTQVCPTDRPDSLQDLLIFRWCLRLATANRGFQLLKKHVARLSRHLWPSRGITSDVFPIATAKRRNLQRNAIYTSHSECWVLPLPSKPQAAPNTMATKWWISSGSTAVRMPCAAMAPTVAPQTTKKETIWEHDISWLYVFIWQCVNTLYPCSSHQNSWDLWMFIPLKMVLIGIDPYPYVVSIGNTALPALFRAWLQPHL